MVTQDGCHKDHWPQRLPDFRQHRSQHHGDADADDRQHGEWNAAALRVSIIRQGSAAHQAGRLRQAPSQTVVVTFRPTLGVGYSGVITVNSDSLAGFNATPASLGQERCTSRDNGRPDILWHHQPSGMLRLVHERSHAGRR